MDENPVVIVAAKRTPIGMMLGNLSSFSAPKLGAIAHKAAMEAAHLPPEAIDEVVSGCVLSAGLGQAPARQAALMAGIPNHAGATTINKMCGSGMKAIMLAHDLLKAQSAKIVLASGMESMSQAPYLLKKARSGYRLGHAALIDHMYMDGLEDAYNHQLMGVFAEKTASSFHFTRSMHDTYAAASMERALRAEEGAFTEEIVPIPIESAGGIFLINKDQGPDRNKLTKIARLPACFQENGTLTAASSSSIADGAASLILMHSDEAKKRQIQPLARVIAHATHAQDPALFPTAPIEAIRAVLQKSGWTVDSVDLFEINEAFATVVMAAIQTLSLPQEKVNIHGGACALGHPIGASGARIVVTLIHALRHHHLKKGVAALCIGGGEATAIAVEIL